MIAIDFFCGAGGLTRGLLDAGIQVVLGIDNDESCRETYERNNYPARFLKADIVKLEFDEVRRHLVGVAPENLLFAACAPCQPFSQLNRNENKDDRATLLGRFARFIEAFQPKYVFLENVPGLSKVRGSSTHKRFLEMLRRHGYYFDDGIVNAKSYGVPQSRRRYVLIAVRGAIPFLPTHTHGNSEGLIPFETVESAIRRYPHIAAGESHPTVPNHTAASIIPRNIERLIHTPEDGGDRRAWPKHLWLECHSGEHKGHTDVYGRMRWNSPAPTLTCKCTSISNGRYGHPTEHRAISLREAASLQSFSDEYIFYGESSTKLATQIGNAVPVRMAQRFGEYLLSVAAE